MVAVTICSDFGAQKNKVSHCFPIYLQSSDGTGCHDLKFSECWALSQLFHSPLSLSSRGSLALLHCLPWEWCHLHIWGYWYFSHQSWFRLVLHPAQRFWWNAVREMHIKLLGKCISKPHLMPVRMALIKKTNRFWECGEKETLIHCW